MKLRKDWILSKIKLKKGDNDNMITYEFNEILFKYCGGISIT